MPIINDKYILSSSLELMVDKDELDTNFLLEPYKEVMYGIVAGTIYDENLCGKRICDATVKIFDLDGKPLFHTETNECGEYSIINVPYGNYKIAAVKEGYYMAIEADICVNSRLPMTKDIVLLDNKIESLNVVYGRVIDELCNPINNVKVSIYTFNSLNDKPIMITHSNVDGDYVLEGIVNGTYKVVYDAINYLCYEVDNYVLCDGVRIMNNVTLRDVIINLYGTISGLITDEDGSVIKNAYVGLYNINDNKEALIKTTYTNSEGRYLFGGLKAGNYIVKAKESSVVE